MKLDIESLRALRTVADVGSVNTAAEMLCISRSAVSWKLKRLQERVGTPILQRDGRGVRLTDSGIELLEYAERILALHDEAARRFASVDVRGTVRIGVTEGASGPLIDTVAPWARRNGGDLDVRIRVDQPVTLAELLERRSLDLVVSMVLHEDVRESDVLLWDDELAWAKGSDSEFDESLPLPLITFGSRCFYANVAHQLLDDAGIDHDVVLESPSIAGVQTAMASGAGVTLTNRRLLTEQHVEITGRPWAGSTFPTPPAVRYVIRTAASEPTEATVFLVDQIRTAFTSAESARVQP